MPDHQEAQAVLTQARDLLAQRLSELVLGSQDELLNDARGESYMGEIGGIYDQVGTRLSQVNAMLASLPAQADNTSTAPGDGSEEAPATFKEFAQRVVNGDLDGAAPILANLLALNAETATRSTVTFGNRLRDYPKTLERTLQLREEIVSGNDNGAIMILLECFALTGTPALHAIEHLKQRFASAA